MLWSILKSSFNNDKIPRTDSLIFKHQSVLDFQEKNGVCYWFFAKQSTIIETGSNFSIKILRGANKSLNTIIFTQDDILNVIWKLDPYKVHRNYQITIIMLQIRDKAICKPSYLIFFLFLHRFRKLPDWIENDHVVKRKEKKKKKKVNIIDLLQYFQFLHKYSNAS